MNILVFLRLLYALFSSSLSVAWVSVDGEKTESSHIGKHPPLFTEIPHTFCSERPDAAKLKVNTMDFSGHLKGCADTAAESSPVPDKTYYLIQK